MEAKDKFRHVVIIGGGIGGVAVALRLCRLSRHSREKIAITLINKENYHSFPPEYYKIITRPVQRQKTFQLSFFGFSSGAVFPLDEIFGSCKNIKVIAGEVIAADFKNRKIKTAEGSEFYFDYLVVSPGSETNFFDNPHIRKYGRELKTAKDALNIKNAIDELFSHKAKHEIIRIAIGGGGFTGCELAAEFGGFLEFLSKIHGHPLSNMEIYLLEASKTILGGASGWLQREAEKRLKKLGVRVMTGSALKDISAEAIYLDNGNNIKYDIFIWLAGVKANRLLEVISPENLLKEKGQLKVGDYLRLKGCENIFVIGDAGSRASFKNKKPIPMAAYVAQEQGRYVANVIMRLIAGEKIRPYVYSGDKFIIPLGPKYALLDFGWLKVSGWLAWLVRQSVILRYYFGILPFGKAFKLWRKGLS